ncbi:MAG: DUF6691 family protein [Saprospiraceae bacterium]
MKFLKYILTGILFGFILTKSEAVSWFRIQEMFRFESFHMFGIIGTAVVLGIILVQIIKRFQLKNMSGGSIDLDEREKGIKRYIIGGTIFGLGWSLGGACPGPMFILLGTGELAFVIVILSAMLGTYAYGAFMDKLPH